MKSEPDKRKIRIARLSVLVAFFLSVLKLSTGFLFHSLGMVSAGVDSLMDLFGATINFLSMKKSVEPADADHPYGHGKIEHIASLFQGGVIGCVGILLIGEGIRTSLSAEDLPDLNAGIYVMIFSAFLSFLMGRKLRRAARETDSPLLEADSLHFSVDTFTNLGVVIALGLTHLTGSVLFDRLTASLIGIWILIAAIRIFRSSLDALMDRNIPQSLQDEINRVIQGHAGEIMGYHRLRTRRSGSRKMVDLHMVVCKDASLEEAHQITEKIEQEIEERIRNSDVLIHLEPCTEECNRVREQCKFKQ